MNIRDARKIQDFTSIYDLKDSIEFQLKNNKNFKRLSLTGYTLVKLFLQNNKYYDFKAVMGILRLDRSILENQIKFNEFYQIFETSVLYAHPQKDELLNEQIINSIDSHLEISKLNLIQEDKENTDDENKQQEQQKQQNVEQVQAEPETKGHEMTNEQLYENMFLNLVDKKNTYINVADILYTVLTHTRPQVSLQDYKDYLFNLNVIMNDTPELNQKSQLEIKKLINTKLTELNNTHQERLSDMQTSMASEAFANAFIKTHTKK